MTDALQLISENVTQILVDAAVGVSSPQGVYPPGAVAIVPGSSPASPDRAITINVTPLSDNITMPDGSVLIEFYVRGAQGDPYGAGKISSAIFDTLHGLANLSWGELTLVQMYRQASISNGQDSSKRQERVEHYYADIGYAPSSNRPTGGSW